MKPDDPNYDDHWRAADPYPAWPFTRVRPEELAKYQRAQWPDNDAKW